MDFGAGKNDMLMRLLGAATLRQEVIAGNIANQNTPGYTRRVVRFEDLVKQALEDGPMETAKVRPTVVEDSLSPAGADGNNVNLELEQNAQRRNRLLYDAYATILQGRFELLRASIQDNS